MDKTILLQKQVRDNSEDLRSYLNDLEKWEQDMKRKESELCNGSGDSAVPIPRNKTRKVENIKSSKKKTKESEEKPQKIKSYDYAAWDKFDVEAECNKLDQKDKEKSESEEEEEPSEEYQTRLRDEANYEKEKGNQFVKNKKWDEAIACYTHSIGCYSKDPIYFANRALCFLKKEDYHSAEADCTSALQLDQTYVKALQRRAAARENLKQYQDAAQDLKKVLEIEPHNKESKVQLEKLEKRLGVGIIKPKRSFSPQPSTSKENLTHPVTIKQVTSEISVVKENKKVVEKIKSKPKQPEILENNKSTESKASKTETKPIFYKQIPWPDRSSSEIILPVKKLPHQRSKKPLRRIEILETNSSDIQLSTNKTIVETKEEKNPISSKLDINYDDSDALAKILAQTNQINVDEIINNIENEFIKSTTSEKSSEKTKEITKIIENIEKSDEETEIIKFPVPKSSVQFYSNWKVMKNNNKSKYLYLKQINPTEIPNIFKDSLESDALSDIIFILNKYFTENTLPVFEYLLYLSNVRRFSALTMFMSSKDKSVLKKLFEYCENSKEVSEEDIDNLRKKYEL